MCYAATKMMFVTFTGNRFLGRSGNHPSIQGHPQTCPWSSGTGVFRREKWGPHKRSCQQLPQHGLSKRVCSSDGIEIVVSTWRVPVNCIAAKVVSSDPARLFSFFFLFLWCWREVRGQLPKWKLKHYWDTKGYSLLECRSSWTHMKSARIGE